MAKKKKNTLKVSFVGTNSENVTGSCTLVEFEDKKILLECGLYQGNNPTEDYKVNDRKFKFKPKEIDYVFLCHAHADHSCLIPRLVKEGFNGRIITTEVTTKLVEPLLYDSCYIIDKTAEQINRQGKVKVTPLYGKEDVDGAISKMCGFDINHLYQLDENISFEFIPNSHIVGSASLKLYLKSKSNHVTKILYTSDMGNIKLKKPFVDEFVKETKCNYVISECTYASTERQIKAKDFDKDKEKIKTIISKAQEEKGRIIIPCFSLDRTQFLLKILYDLYQENPDFDLPIVVDSPLSKKITDVYREVLKDENKEIIEEICNWEKLRFIVDVNESKACVTDKSPKIVLSASGMAQAGRIRKYLKECIPDGKSHVIFCGFCVEGSLGWKIKNISDQKTISIDGKPYRNRCNIHNLKSLSSHIQRDDLINYLSQINCEKIFLVHGNMKDKIEFARELQGKLEKESKTTRVVAVTKGTSFTR